MSKKNKTITEKSKPWTISNWQGQFAQTDYDYVMLLGRMDAVEANSAYLENLVSAAKDFETLKKELLIFTKSQTKLINFINKKWESDENHKYNLPRMGIKLS